MASTSEPATAVELVELLADHGDRQVPPGMIDLAVNVVADTPGWLREELATVDLTRYPDTTAARVAASARHGVDAGEVLLTNGAAEAFWAIAHGLRPRLATCVHPSFTAPEAALRSAGVAVHRVVRRPEQAFALDPTDVPDEADLVVLGRPDNPTGRVESIEVVTALARPGRVVVVDEAFADFLPDGDSLTVLGLPGMLCVRSLTKLWGLPGLRVGYVLGDPDLLTRLASALQPWPVNALAAHAVVRLSAAEPERRVRAAQVAENRAALVDGVAGLGEELAVWVSPANFILLETPVPGVRDLLLAQGMAVRRCDTFPGLDDTWARVAVPERPEDRRRLLTALRRITFAARALAMNS